MLSCKDATRLQLRAQDEGLSFPQRFALRLHLAFCDNCRRFARQLALIRAACRRIQAGQEPPADAPGLSPEAKARILDRLEHRQEPDGP